MLKYIPLKVEQMKQNKNDNSVNCRKIKISFGKNVVIILHPR